MKIASSSLSISSECIEEKGLLIYTIVDYSMQSYNDGITYCIICLF